MPQWAGAWEGQDALAAQVAQLLQEEDVPSQSCGMAELLAWLIPKLEEAAATEGKEPEATTQAWRLTTKDKQVQVQCITLPLQKDQTLRAIHKQHPQALKLVGPPSVLLYRIQNMGSERHAVKNIPGKLVLQGQGGTKKTYALRSLIKKGTPQNPHNLSVLVDRGSIWHEVNEKGVKQYKKGNPPKQSNCALLVCYSAADE